MNGTLERRYRRLLHLYPKAFRREHEEEILAVLMASAAKAQTRPRLVETFNLLIHALLWRARHTSIPNPSRGGVMNFKWADENAAGIDKRIPAFEYRHPRLFCVLLTCTGAWFVILTAILYGYGVGGWWGAVLMPAAAVTLFFAYRLRVIAGKS